VPPGSSPGEAQSLALHIWHNYGKRSEIWLYRRLVHSQRWGAHILARPPADRDSAIREQPWPASTITYLPTLTEAGRTLERLRAEAGRFFRGRPGGAYVRCLGDALAKGRYALVNIHADVTRYWPTVRRRGLPFVASFYGSDLLRRRKPRGLRRLRAALSQADAITVSSRLLRDRAVDLGAAPALVHVVHTGIDLGTLPDAEAVLRLRETSRGKGLRIVSVTRLVPVKAPEELPRLAGRLKARGLDFTWTLVGDGPLRGAVESVAQQEGVLDRFRFAGSLPFDGVVVELSNADVMVHHAQRMADGRLESLCTALIEAGAMALPVVSVSLGGIPEVVIDGTTGRLAPEGDPEGLVQRILQLGQDPGLRLAMGRAAMRHTRERFDSARAAAQCETLFDLVSGARR
jgi:glycosyltransferase involved in cell wall biosynthesis